MKAFKLKRILGFAVRGLRGYIHNIFEEPTQIPGGIERFEIGKSTKGAAIDCYKIGEGEKNILIVAGIHGNEVGSIKLGYKIINWLFSEKTNYQNFSFYIIPCLNVDGYIEAKTHPDYFNGGRVGRFNSRGVDLNRNFGTPSFKKESVWSRGKNYSETVNVNCGEAPFSEPETGAIKNFIETKNIKILIALHNAAGEAMSSITPLAQKMTKAFTEASGYKLETEESWKKLNQTGTAKEWCDINKIDYLEIEGRYRWGSDWGNNKPGLEAVLNELQL